MPDPNEIPELAAELVDLSKEYLRQETVEPARRLGRAVGLYLLAGLLFAGGAMMLSLAALRIISDALPESGLWSAVAYGLAALLSLAVAGAVIFTATREGMPTEEEPH